MKKGYILPQNEISQVNKFDKANTIFAIVLFILITPSPWFHATGKKRAEVWEGENLCCMREVLHN